MTSNRLPLLLALLFVLHSATSHSQVNKFHTWNLSIGADALFPENNFKKHTDKDLALPEKLNIYLPGIPVSYFPPVFIPLMGKPIS